MSKGKIKATVAATCPICGVRMKKGKKLSAHLRSEHKLKDGEMIDLLVDTLFGLDVETRRREPLRVRVEKETRS